MLVQSLKKKVTNVRGNLNNDVELMWILLMEIGKGSLTVNCQSNCIHRTVWNISYRMAAPHYVMLCVCLFVILGKE